MVSEAVLDHFVEKIDFDGPGGCWLWTGAASHLGYGRCWDGSATRLSHRFVYYTWVEPFDPHLTIDHLCKTPRCVNPDHLEPVPKGVNTMRGEGTGPRNARKTHCIRGHELTPDNLVKRSREGRECRLCHSERERQRKERKDSRKVRMP